MNAMRCLNWEMGIYLSKRVKSSSVYSTEVTNVLATRSISFRRTSEFFASQLSRLSRVLLRQMRNEAEDAGQSQPRRLEKMPHKKQVNSVLCTFLMDFGLIFN